MSKVSTLKLRFRAHNAAILGVDTAANSGIAVRVEGRLVCSGEVDTTRPEQVTEAVQYAVEVARRRRVPLCAILEKPWGGSTSVLVGLGVARGAWLRAFDDAGLSKRRVVSVMPNTWRSAVFGRRWVRAKRDEIRAHELASACAATGRSDIKPDEAAAIWISQWGAYAPLVGERVGRRD